MGSGHVALVNGQSSPVFGANLMVLDGEYDKAVRVFLKERLIGLFGFESMCGDVCLLGVLV